MEQILQKAQRLIEDAAITFEERPVGLMAAHNGHPSAPNYRDCFVRDFTVSGLWFLLDGQPEWVRNFLETVLEIREQELAIEGHEILPGIMPASFRVAKQADGEQILADFGDRAIGRVAPVDSMMWWTILLAAYVRVTGDRSLLERPDCRDALRTTLTLCLQGSFEVFPTLLVPDAAFMIDRRMGVYGHPLEIQALFYGMLLAMAELSEWVEDDQALARRAERRQTRLLDYIRRYYWMDRKRLGELYREQEEELGSQVRNIFNLYPESIPEWVDPWLPEPGGYFTGNLGVGRIDPRFFAQGNLLAILFGLADSEQARAIMDLYETRWDDLMGAMPLKIVFPALEGEAWRLQTGSDPKNRPWSYHNGGNWPVLLWVFAAAAVRTGRPEMAERAWKQAAERLAGDQWPEYYDGRHGGQPGEQANRDQVWSAAGLLLSRRLLDDAGATDRLFGFLPRDSRQ